MVAGEKSHICLEGDIIPATDSYLHLQSIYNQCLEGARMGFQKGHTINIGRTPWNKGKKGVYSEKTLKSMSKRRAGMFCGEDNPAKRPEVRAKISASKIGNKAKLGCKLSEESIRRVSEAKMGSKNPNFGNTMLIEQKQKRSENAKINPNYGMKNKHHTDDTINKISKANKGRPSPNRGKHATDKTKKKLSETHSGEKSYFWKGGISFLPYCSKFNRQLKEAVRDRDNRTCQLCNEKENGEKLSVHHIHHDKDNCYPDLIALCRKCNAKVSFNKDYYENLFMNKLNNRGLLLWVYRQEVI